MAVPEKYYFEVSDRAEVKDFIEKYHYSQNINGVNATYCFALRSRSDGELVGAMLFGQLGMAGTWKRYAENEKDVLELRRLVLVDDTPRNSESWFISHALRWLKKNTQVKTIVSYADPNYGHEGIVYKATNFELVGKTSPGVVIMWNGKKYHDRSARVKYKGRLKPFAQRLKTALDLGEAEFVKQVPKNIYVYRLRKE